MKVLKQQLDERRNAAERKTVDFFDLVIDELNKHNPTMNENIALDLLFLLLFASHETTSMGLTAILKFLTDNPKALQELTVSKRFIATTRSFVSTSPSKIDLYLSKLFCIWCDVFRRSMKKSWQQADSDITWEEYKKSMKFTSHVCAIVVKKNSQIYLWSMEESIQRLSGT